MNCVRNNALYYITCTDLRSVEHSPSLKFIRNSIELSLFKEKWLGSNESVLSLGQNILKFVNNFIYYYFILKYKLELLNSFQAMGHVTLNLGVKPLQYFFGKETWLQCQTFSLLMRNYIITYIIAYFVSNLQTRIYCSILSPAEKHMEKGLEF